MSSIVRQQHTVALMIGLYCRHKHGTQELCDDCRELLNYATARLERCQYGDNKKACRQCTTHCYKPDMRDKIRVVMRFAGPRMLFYAPWQTLKHWLKG